MSKETFERIEKFIKEVGFPIGVAIWLLYQANTAIKELTETMNQLNRTMIEISIKVREK